MKDFNGYDFDDAKMRKRMKFVVISKGDLDINNAYAFKSEVALKGYLKDNSDWRKPEAIFKIEDVSQKYI